MPLSHAPAMSNAERQRKFRECNPGYYARLQANRRASLKRYADHQKFLMLTAYAEELARAEALAAEQVVREPLLLPAPKETFGLPWEIVRPAIREAVAVEATHAGGD
ncbi:MAG: hypothetical protein QM754_12900 [Tepidisphaeraceae bacterium]